MSMLLRFAVVFACIVGMQVGFPLASPTSEALVPQAYFDNASMLETEAANRVDRARSSAQQSAYYRSAHYRGEDPYMPENSYPRRSQGAGSR